MKEYSFYSKILLRKFYKQFNKTTFDLINIKIYHCITEARFLDFMQNYNGIIRIEYYFIRNEDFIFLNF